MTMQGSAFCLQRFKSGDCVFATATHVVRDLVDRRDVEAHILLPEGLDTREKRHHLISVQINEIAFADSYNDVALMVVNYMQSEFAVTPPKIFEVNFSLPQVGQPCLLFGYPQEPGASTYRLQASQGTIEEIHPSKRDRSLSTFPSFRTSAIHKHGMSGGPVQDTSGKIIGVISHGTSKAEGVEFSYGYAASIGAVLELELELVNDLGKKEKVRVSDIANMGLIGVKDGSSMTLHRNDEGVMLSWLPGQHG
jgi:S1-C subfamily serine protease